MNDSEDRFEFHGLLCFARQPENRSFSYAPLSADLQRDAAGNPMFTVIAIGARGYLMLTAAWQVSELALAELRGEIARRYNLDDPATVTLTLAPVHVVKCELLLGDGSAEFHTIATSATSGAPPYSALFNVSLTEEQVAAVAAAIDGRAGFLAVEYEVSVTTPLTASAQLVSRSPRFVPWLRSFSSAGPAGLRAAIEEAVADGLAVVQLSLLGGPPADLVAELYDRVLTRATEVLPGLIERWNDDQGEIEIGVTLVVEASQRLTPRADLSDLDLGPDHVTVAGTAAPAAENALMAVPTPMRALRVGLGFDPTDAPLAWIRVQWDGSEAVLEPPRFSPVEVWARPRSPTLTVTTGYTDGAPARRKEILPPLGAPELTLTPGALGLTLVSVDARPLARAGARSAQVWLRHRPPDGRGEHRHSIEFGEGAWVAYWWLATPVEPSPRYLDYRWTTVDTDGRVAGQPFVPADSADIVLSFPEGVADATDRQGAANQ